VQLPSNTRRKPITSITAVLVPFMTYLLILPRTFGSYSQLLRYRRLSSQDRMATQAFSGGGRAGKDWRGLLLPDAFQK
jgi:hypothetical protein